MINRQQLKEWALTPSPTEIEPIKRTKVHLENYESKNFDTDGNYKSIVRIFKNIKNNLVENHLIEDKIASYCFIESLLYNCSSPCFDGDYPECTMKTLQFLLDALDSKRMSGFICLNEKDSLFSETTWNFVDAQQFILAVSNYYLEKYH